MTADGATSYDVRLAPHHPAAGHRCRSYQSRPWSATAPQQAHLTVTLYTVFCVSAGKCNTAAFLGRTDDRALAGQIGHVISSRWQAEVPWPVT